MVKKIIINGREYPDLVNIPEALKGFLKDNNANGVPDRVEELVEKARTTGQAQKSTNISIKTSWGGQGNLPQEMTAQVSGMVAQPPTIKINERRTSTANNGSGSQETVLRLFLLLGVVAVVGAVWMLLGN